MKQFCRTILGLYLVALSSSAVFAAEAPSSTAPAKATPRVVIEKALHFDSASGGTMVLDPGSYGVAAMDAGGLQLTSASGNPQTVAAMSATHDEKLAQARALIVPVGEDERHLVLLLPGGKRLEAVGSLSGMHSRGVARPAVASNLALQSALAMSPAVAMSPAAPAQPSAPPAPSPQPGGPYTGQLIAPPPVVVPVTCSERPAAGQPPAAELEPAYGRLSVATQPGGGGAVRVPKPFGVELSYLSVPGSRAMVVERAIDGTTVWSVAGTTCANPELFTFMPGGSSAQPIFSNTFVDVSGGIVPRTTYVYRVTAIGAPGTGGGFAGQVWWNQIKWTAPDSIAPQWIDATTASTGALHVHWRFDSPGNPYMPAQPSAYTVSTTGWSAQAWGPAVRRSPPCSGFVGCTYDFPAPPSGAHVFTLTAYWNVPINGVFQTFATTSSDLALTVP